VCAPPESKKWHDPSFALNERLSDPPQGVLGRFISRDPIGHRGGLNLYSYADNSPVSMTDHAGLQPGGGEQHAIFTGDYGMDPGAYTIVDGPYRSRCQEPPTADDISLLSEYDKMNLRNLAKALGIDEDVLLTGGGIIAMLALLRSLRSGGGGLTRSQQQGGMIMVESNWWKSQWHGSPAFSPRDISKRASARRKQLGLPGDESIPLPDRGPGQNIKGSHDAAPKTPHPVGQRNVGAAEEHSRRSGKGQQSRGGCQGH